MSDFAFGFFVALPCGLIIGAWMGVTIVGLIYERRLGRRETNHAEAIGRALARANAPNTLPPQRPYTAGRNRKVWFDSAGHPHFMDQEALERALKAASEKLGEFRRSPPKH